MGTTDVCRATAAPGLVPLRARNRRRHFHRGCHSEFGDFYRPLKIVSSRTVKSRGATCWRRAFSVRPVTTQITLVQSAVLARPNSDPNFAMP
jgi:hypothetical protein